MQKKFKTRLENVGPSGAWLHVKIPFDVEKTFGTKARLSVKGTINGFAFQSSIFPDGEGKHTMMINKAMQKGANAVRGDVVDMVLEPDTEPRIVEVPTDLKTLLTKSKTKDVFEKMTYSRKKEYVEWIESAKREETRTARVQKIIDKLLSGDTKPLR
jgi:hypothetical protein